MIKRNAQEGTPFPPPFLRGAVAAALIALCACSTLSRPGEYRHKVVRSGSSDESTLAEQKIAEGATYQVFFSLRKEEKCLKIAFSSRIREATLKKTFQSDVNTYFIIEKSVDIERFKDEKKTIFYEIGRNFDLRWNLSNTMVTCSDSADPLRKLDTGLYRIRFSSLKAPSFEYVLEIYSNNGPVSFGF